MKTYLASLTSDKPTSDGCYSWTYLFNASDRIAAGVEMNKYIRNLKNIEPQNAVIENILEILVKKA